MGLLIGPGSAEELLGAVDRQLFNGIDVFTARNNACVGIFGVFIRQDRPLSLHHSSGREILTGDQLEVCFLLQSLLLDQFCNGWI